MRITPISNYTLQQNRTINNKTNNTSFTGAKLKMIKGLLTPINSNDQALFKNDLGLLLDISSNDVEYLTQPQKKYKFNLLYDLADKYNRERGHLNKGQQKESFNILIKIFDKINDPQYVHHKLLSHTNYSFNDIKKIIELSNNEKSKLSLINNLLDVKGQHNKDKKISANVVMHFLTIPTSNKVAKDFEAYKPYIILNQDKPNVAEMLDAQIKKGYYPKYYANKLAVEQRIKGSTLLANLDKNKIIKNFDSNKLNILERFDNIYAAQTGVSTLSKEENAILMEKTNDILWDIYDSTNSKNLNLRKDLIKYTERHTPFEKRLEDASLEEYLELFNNIDYNKDVKKYVKNALKNHYNIISIKELNKLIEHNDIKLLNKYAKEIDFINSQYAGIVDYSEESLKKVSQMGNKHHHITYKTPIYGGKSNIYKAYETSKMTENSDLYNQDHSHKQSLLARFMNSVTSIFSK